MNNKKELLERKTDIMAKLHVLIMSNLHFIEMFMDNDDTFSPKEIMKFKIEAYKASAIIMSELFKVMEINEEISIDEMFKIMDNEFNKYIHHAKKQDEITKEIRNIMRKS